MEIIKRRSDEGLIEVTCSHCGSILRCTGEEKKTLPCPVCGDKLNDGDDLLRCDRCDYKFSKTEPEGIGEYGSYYTFCPECGEKVYMDDGIDVTVENLKLDYFSPMGGKEVTFPRIKSWIAEGIRFLEDNPDENTYYTASGDSFIFICRDVGDFYVMYTNKYRDVYIKDFYL